MGRGKEGVSGLRIDLDGDVEGTTEKLSCALLVFGVRGQWELEYWGVKRSKCAV